MSESIDFFYTVPSSSTISSGAINTPTLGAGASECEEMITRILHPSFRGKKNWQALVSALAVGDCIVKENAELAQNQYYISTASEKYLDARAGAKGVKRPSIGINDEFFRDLAISIINNKLTQTAFLDVLEVMYGVESVRGFAETALEEPFVLNDESTLDLLFDETTVVKVVFNREDFTVLRRAKAIEVAEVINRALNDLAAFAEVKVDPETGGSKVRIFSGLKGLKSSVRITSGTANPDLQFATSLFPPPDPLPVPGTWGNWEVSIQPNGIARYSLDSDTYTNFSQVLPGDYIVVRDHNFSDGNIGSFVVTDVRYSYIGPVLDQWVEVYNPNAVAESFINQLEWEGLTVWRAHRSTVYDHPNYCTVVQAGGKALVSIPVTTQVVNREKYHAAYGNVNDSIDIDTVTRSGSVVTVTTTDAHGFNPGDQFIIDGFFPDGYLRAGGINGFHKAVTASGVTLTFDTPDYAVNTSGSGGTVTSVKAAPSLLAGPFVYNPDDGFTIVPEDESTTDMRLDKGVRYNTLTLTTNGALVFPDEPGYLVFRFGYSNAVGPVKYLGRLSSEELALDASFKFPDTIETGSVVTFVSSRSPFTPEEPESVGSAYITGANEGRLTAIDILNDISAAGIPLEITTRYPSDIGLGNEGFPVEGNHKLSDIVRVYGSDDLAELSTLREEG